MMYIEHITKEGERLDTIAFKYWGDTNLVPLLVLDNRHLPTYEEAAPGTVVYVRDSVEDVTLINKESLPPWR